jgi:hypothetical protein
MGTNTITYVFISHISFVDRISNKGDDTQSINTVKSSEDGLFVKRLRSLFPAVEIKVEHVNRFLLLLTMSTMYVFVVFLLSLLFKGRISAGHDTLPYGLLVRFSTMNSTFKSVSPAKYTPHVDLMTLIYTLKYRNLRIQLYPIRVYKGDVPEM